MPEFRFAPRALLELGKELISSDDVALYELIKNSVDAGSPTIDLEIQAVLPASAYRSALELLDTKANLSDVLTHINNTIFRTTSGALREAFINPLTELVDGSGKDFRAALVALYAKHNWIKVSDRGHGMTLAELSDVYLVVGTRSRREKNIAGGTFLGDKGVGRLSAMRLGDGLEVVTTTKGDSRYSEIQIDWSLFDHDSVKSLSDIQILPKAGKNKSDTNIQGTTVTIRSLSSDWSSSRFREMLDGDIARMVDPFDPGKANKLLIVQYNGDRVLVPSIPPKLLEAAHATCKITFDFNEDDEPRLTGTIDYKLKNKKETISIVGTELYSIAQRSQKRRGKKGHAQEELAPISPKALRTLGPFSADIYWYNRAVVEAISGLADTVTKTRKEIGHWSGGPMLYRRGFRILPYGDPDDDWLQLDKKAFGSEGFKLNRQQIIGRISISSGHVALSEQTNREGLIQSDASDALDVIMKWLLHTEFRGLINEADKLDKLSSRHSETATARMRGAQVEVEDSLDALRRVAGSNYQVQIERIRNAASGLVKECEALFSNQERAIAETALEREKFVHLAGVGLITEFIFHELDRSVNHALKLIPGSRGSKREGMLEALEDQLKTLQKRVSAFDELSGEKRQSKSTFDLSEVVETVLENHANQFGRHSIAVEFDKPDRPFKVRAVRGMVIQILENLVVNAVYWLKQQKRFEKALRPRITISIDEDDKALTFEDNGTGIDPTRGERIFQPFVTSKPPTDGGRGLGLYIARELAEYHGWSLYLDDEVGRVKKGRLSLFVLDMDADDA